MSFFFYPSGDHRDLHFSLHDALPICRGGAGDAPARPPVHDRRDARAHECARRRRPHPVPDPVVVAERSEEHTSELQSHSDLVCRLLLEKKKNKIHTKNKKQTKYTTIK